MTHHQLDAREEGAHFKVILEHRPGFESSICLVPNNSFVDKLHNF